MSEMGDTPTRENQGQASTQENRIEVGLPQILDLLSEFLALKDAAVDVYSAALQRANGPRMREQLSEYHQQNERHSDLLRNAIRDLGGNPVYLSPLAQLEQERTEQLRNLTIIDRYRQILDMETILYVEALDQANWAFLKAILPQLENERVREVLSDIVNEVEGQDLAHVRWARQTLSELRMLEFTVTNVTMFPRRGGGGGPDQGGPGTPGTPFTPPHAA